MIATFIGALIGSGIVLMFSEWKWHRDARWVLSEQQKALKELVALSEVHIRMYGTVSERLARLELHHPELRATQRKEQSPS